MRINLKADRGLKRLATMGEKLIEKPRLTDKPANRRERRALERALRREKKEQS